MKHGIVTNPYLPSYEYVPDGEPHVFGDRLYIFGSHDKFDGKAYCENDYVCWSTPVTDLTDWRYEGIIYQTAQDPFINKKWQHMYAPDVAQGPDGRFYLYYGLGFKNQVNIAVCDTPAGKYAYYGYVQYPDGSAYGSKKKEPLRFDPAVLADDDGKVYLYTGFSSSAGQARLMSAILGVYIDGAGNAVVRLDSDMKTVITEPKRVIPGHETSKGTGFEGHEFYEASSIRKFNEKYYAIYSSVLSHELAYAVSDRPDGGFVFKGTLHSNAGIGYEEKTEAETYWGNNHGSIEFVNGKYYIFGHRQTNGSETSRQGIAEILEQDSEGNFLQAQLTSQGLYGSPLPMDGTYEAAIACCLRNKKGVRKTGIKGNYRRKHPYFTQDGMDRECDPGQYIAHFSDGCVAGYRYFQMPDKDISVNIQIRSHGRKEANGSLIISNTDQFLQPSQQRIICCGEHPQTVTIPLCFEAGQQELWIKYEGTSSIDVLRIAFQ